jgi:hypothetical protein
MSAHAWPVYRDSASASWRSRPVGVVADEDVPEVVARAFGSRVRSMGAEVIVVTHSARRQAVSVMAIP